MAEEKSDSEKRRGELRREAEEMLHRAPTGEAEADDRGARELVHELQVYQLELEMQNEELHQAQLRLQTARDRYQELYDFAPVGYFTLDASRQIHEVNLTGADLLDAAKQTLKGQPFSRFIQAEDQEAFHLHCRQASNTQEVQVCEVRLEKTDGSSFYAELETVAELRLDGSSGPLYVAVSDITWRKQAEEQMREYQKQLRALAHALTVSEEKERQRLAADLHDQASQTLVLAQMKTRLLRRQTDSGIATEHLDEISDQLDQLDQAIHSLIFELSPPVLHQMGLEAAVEWLAEHFRNQGVLQVEVEDDKQPKPLDEDLRPLTFRTVRELLMNVIKHAGMDQARVCMRRQEDMLHIEVIDGGIGFDAGRQQAGQGFGLFSIRERMEFIGGRCHLRSASGQGTQVTLEVPLSRKG